MTTDTDKDYKNGRIVFEVPGWSKYSIAGVYMAEISSVSVDPDWAKANGLKPSVYVPTVSIGNNLMDLRYAAKTTFTATRKTEGVAMSGTVSRGGQRMKGGYGLCQVPVKLQKKVGSTWVTKKTVTTDSHGRYSGTVNDSAKATWRAYVANTSRTWATDKGASVAKKESGKAKTSISRSWNASGKKFTGTVKFNAGGNYYAAQKGVKVHAQKKSGSSWKVVKSMITNSSGQYTYKTSSRGTYRFVVVGTKKYNSKASTTYKR